MFRQNEQRERVFCAPNRRPSADGPRHRHPGPDCAAGGHYCATYNKRRRCVRRGVDDGAVQEIGDVRIAQRPLADHQLLIAQRPSVWRRQDARVEQLVDAIDAADDDRRRATAIAAGAVADDRQHDPRRRRCGVVAAQQEVVAAVEHGVEVAVAMRRGARRALDVRVMTNEKRELVAEAAAIADAHIGIVARRQRARRRQLGELAGHQLTTPDVVATPRKAVGAPPLACDAPLGEQRVGERATPHDVVARHRPHGARRRQAIAAVSTRRRRRHRLLRVRPLR